MILHVDLVDRCGERNPVSAARCADPDTPQCDQAVTFCLASAPLPLGAPSKQIGSSMSNDDDEQAGTVDPYLDDLYKKLTDALRKK